ncbi:hypothetical protein KQI89_13820 [Clostridium sp. MSJ-4]|uniref:Uncharacterized protein n=1 Tax=Clostridium simiarum TaxID=2841506 RepID=A0ABS6F3F5_9CLOT|nr:hypothetical protein [Clostridium simiarum]MBU5592826.1 hypothetical protein [Clostridium simiarum]
MKRIIKTVAVIIILPIIALWLLRFKSEFNINIMENDLKVSKKFKGLKGAIDFEIDQDGNYFVAFKDHIQYIDNRGKSDILFKEENIEISSIAIKDEYIYYSSLDKVYKYNKITEEKEKVLDNIPNFGDYNKSNIMIKDESLFVTIGSATNSAIVGPDNLWVSNNPFNYDITPKTITIRGTNFENGTTGAFVPYKTKNISGQIVPGHFPGNASIIKYDIDSKKTELYAWGIRNVTALDYDSSGKIIGIVGGIEDRGLRPLKGDCDYIYNIKAGVWYGWPDYSGGDPVDSPRFKDNESRKISFLLDKHPSTNPPAPLYQHNKLSTLRELVIDKKGHIGEENVIYFYDIEDNIIYSLAKESVLKEFIKFQGTVEVSSMKFNAENLNILDKSSGILYEVKKGEIINNYALKRGIIYCILGVIGMIIISILWQSKNS